MSNLIAVAYPDVETAQSAAAELGQLMTEHSITLDDLVVIERRPDGKVKLHQAGGGGEVIQSSLDNETEAHLDAVLARRGAAA
jgi:uncharacterized membrane protein